MGMSGVPAVRSQPEDPVIRDSGVLVVNQDSYVDVSMSCFG